MFLGANPQQFDPQAHTRLSTAIGNRCDSNLNYFPGNYSSGLLKHSELSP